MRRFFVGAIVWAVVLGSAVIGWAQSHPYSHGGGGTVPLMHHDSMDGGYGCDQGTCNQGSQLWDDYCAPGCGCCRPHLLPRIVKGVHRFFDKLLPCRGCGVSSCGVGCCDSCGVRFPLLRHLKAKLCRHCSSSCGSTAGFLAPSCGCDAGPSCGCDQAPSCGCDGRSYGLESGQGSSFEHRPAPVAPAPAPIHRNTAPSRPQNPFQDDLEPPPVPRDTRAARGSRFHLSHASDRSVLVGSGNQESAKVRKPKRASAEEYPATTAADERPAAKGDRNAVQRATDRVARITSPPREQDFSTAAPLAKAEQRKTREVSRDVRLRRTSGEEKSPSDVPVNPLRLK